MIMIIPLVGTTVGAAAVFLMKNTLSQRIEKLMSGFASGVMIAASFWSLIVPSIEMSGGYTLRFFPAAAGFAVGIGFLLLLDRLIPEVTPEKQTGAPHREKTGRIQKMVLAVTIHNIPEGMAVGVAAAAAIKGVSGVSFTAALLLSLGIGIQNFPEGAIVSMPLRTLGISRKRAFLLGTLSGAVEPIAGGVTLLLSGVISTLLPYLLSFAAGAMIYVVTQELIPESSTGEHRASAALGLAAGFLLMMALDVQFG